MDSWDVIFKSGDIVVEKLAVNGNLFQRILVGPRESPGAMAVAINNKNEFLLVRQYRHALGFSLWGVPRGGAKTGELHEETAIRELQEETGYKARASVLLGFTYPDSGILCSKVAVVLLKIEEQSDCGYIESKNDRITDGEVDEIEWFGESEIASLVRSGELADSMSLAALYMAKNYLENNAMQ